MRGQGEAACAEAKVAEARRAAKGSLNERKAADILIRANDKSEDRHWVIAQEASVACDPGRVNAALNAAFVVGSRREELKAWKRGAKYDRMLYRLPTYADDLSAQAECGGRPRTNGPVPAALIHFSGRLSAAEHRTLAAYLAAVESHLRDGGDLPQARDALAVIASDPARKQALDDATGAAEQRVYAIVFLAHEAEIRNALDPAALAVLDQVRNRIEDATAPGTPWNSDVHSALLRAFGAWHVSRGVASAETAARLAEYREREAMSATPLSELPPPL